MDFMNFKAAELEVICPKHGQHSQYIHSSISGHDRYWCMLCWLESLNELTAAAVLRAAACQLTSAKAINTLRAIADELEAKVMEKPVTAQQHPITPPPELFKQWEDDILNERDNVDHVLDCAWRDGFQAGADQELEACEKYWMTHGISPEGVARMREHRRPKPPSLKEQALGALYAIATGADDTREFHQDIETIKAALEQLDD